MMTFLRILLALQLLLIAISTRAQIQFEQLAGAAPQSALIANLHPQAYGDACKGDVDGDGDDDVLVTGVNLNFQPITVLYRNTGNGFEADQSNSFVGLANSANAFADLNGDGHPDIIMTGFDPYFIPGTYVYLNDGSGNFTLDATAGIEPCAWGDMAIADMDNDTDMDVFVCGYDSLGALISKMYENDGSGNFSEVAGTPFEPVWNGAVALADIDGDTLPEIVLSGENGSGVPVCNLYANNGSNSFSLVGGTPFTGVVNGAVAVAHINADAEPDVVLAGADAGGNGIARIYLNSGGVFALSADSSLAEMSAASIDAADLNGDTFVDLVLAGDLGNTTRATKVYLNTGSGSFTESGMQPVAPVSDGSVLLVDADGDLDYDLLSAGESTYNFGQPFAQLFENDGSGQYTAVTSSPFAGYINCSIGTADVDGDLDLDALIAGEQSDGTVVTELYLNTGNGLYTLDTTNTFDSLSFGTINFADIDGDLDLDLLISGADNANVRVTTLYTNDGSGNFTEVVGDPFEDVFDSAIGFADVDNDQDLDVLITGANNNSGTLVAKLYTNDGSGSFTEVGGTLFTAVYNSELAFADVNGDSLQDVFIFGSNNFFPQSPTARLYINGGGGSFSFSATPAVTATITGGIAFADFDGDGDADLVATGADGSSTRTAKLYSNDGSGTFTLEAGTPFEGVTASAVSATDFDGDQDIDLLIAGYNSADEGSTKLYTNNGAGDFNAATTPTLFHFWRGDIAAADIDGDGDADVLCAGEDSLARPQARVYLNHSCPVPDGMQVFNIQDTSAIVVWDTVAGAIGYRIHYKPIGAGSWSVEMRNGQQGFMQLSGLAPNTNYMWRVQSSCGPGSVGALTRSSIFKTLNAPCAVPTGLSTAPVGTDKARLNWTQQSGAVKYRIRWRAVGGSWTIVPKDATWSKHWLTGLASNTQYEWQIKTVCQPGASSGTLWSDVQSFQTAAPKWEPTSAQAQSEGFAVAPNPSIGLLTVQFSGSAPIGQEIVVHDALGRVVKRERIAASSTVLDLMDCPKGLYLLVVGTGAEPVRVVLE